MKKLLLKSMLLLCALIVGSGTMWATTYKAYTGGVQQASTTISAKNVSSGTVGVISWTGTSCSYSSSRVNIEANGSITFTASSGYNITKIVIISGSSDLYYGTWTSNPSVTPTGNNSGTTTFDGLEANSVTVTTSTAFRCTSASSISIYYAAVNSNTCATPIFSPAAGAVAANTEVTISSTTEGATIYYTTDGSAPTTSSNVYSAPITIDAAKTIKAFAVKSGLLDSDVATATYTIALPCATPTFSIAAGEVAKGTKVTISSETEGATIYYTTNGSTPTTSSSVYSSAITISSAMTLKAIAVKDGMVNSEVASVAYTIKDYAILPFAWAGGISYDLEALDGVTTHGIGEDYAESHAPYRVKFDGTGDYILIKTNTQPGKVTIGVKKIGGAGNSKITVQGSSDGSHFVDVEELTISGSASAVVSLSTTKDFASTDRYVKLCFTKSSNVGVGPISIAIPEPSVPTTSGDVTYLTTSDNMAGWRAFYDKDNSYSVDGNTKVYVADADPVGTTITLTAIAGIPANVPVILHTSSSADSHKMTLTKETEAPYTYPDDNKLSWETAAVTDKYRLGFGASGVGFYPYSGTPTSGAVILNVDSSTSGARELTIGFEDETTGLSEIKNTNLTNNTNEFFDLQGRKVAQPTKGMYIVNGKKVIIK